MYIRVTSTPNSPRKSVKIVEGIRHGLKVKQVMVHHVGVASNEAEIEKLKTLGRELIADELLRRAQSSNQIELFGNENVAEIAKNIELASIRKRGRKPKATLQDIRSGDVLSLSDLVETKRVVEGIHEVAGSVYDKFGFDCFLKRKKERDMMRDLVLLRLANPASKYATQKILEKQFSVNHDLDSIYRLMDKIFENIDSVKKQSFEQALKRSSDKVDVLFFDCTTLYFESTEVDELRKFGYSKDHRFNTTQLVLALATTPDGLPIGYELFEGNKAEVKTLLECVESWKTLFSIGAVCFVADRAMMSDKNLSLLEKRGHKYIVAAKLRSFSDEVKAQILDEKKYTEQEYGKDPSWVAEFKHGTRRLVVSYKPSRADRDAHQREQILTKLEKQIGSDGKTEKLISNKGVKKYTTSSSSKTIVDEDKITRDAEWDGLHGVISNILEEPGVKLLRRYGNLWKIEESFRLNKHTLSMRPIFHFKPERIKAHIAICYMAFSTLRHMEHIALLTQKVSPQTILSELMGVQASYYADTSTGREYRVPGTFSHAASKIYRALRIERRTAVQELKRK